MNNFIKTKLFILPCFFIFASCATKNTVQEQHDDDHSATSVRLSAARQQAIGIELGEITQRNLRTSLKVNGKLTLPPQNQAQVSSLAGGIVKSISVTEGAFVKQGQVLATIESSEFIQLQQDYLQCQSQLEFLKAEYIRQTQLQEDKINATKTFQKAESDYKTELTKHYSLIQKLKLYNTAAGQLTAETISNTFAITAPIAGNIHTISINIGSFTEPNKQLFDIVDNRFLHIDLTIFEKDISKIHEGQQLTFTDANDPSHEHNATVFSVNKAFEEGQQAIIAHAKIENVGESLLPGMFIEARITIDDNTSPSLPSEAIVSNGNDHFIFAEQEPYTYRQVAVRTGTTDMNFTEVIPLEEISAHQKIVLKGAYYLLSELTKGEGEHNH